MTEAGLIDEKPKCGLCKMPPKQNCWQGEMEYADGSSRLCPHWDKHLNTISDMDGDFHG